jgi:hypothetical protein
MNLKKSELEEIAKSINIDYASLMAFISVESGGLGFATDTGKIIIQFEPAWFKKYVKSRKKSDKSSWSLIDANRVEGQKNEWLAFNAAFKINPQSALLSTSIGLMQVMGFNYSSMGYKSVNAMWDDFKTGEYAQVKGAAMFIKNNSKLYNALEAKDWPKVAYYYNGSNYKINNYDVKLEKAYNKYINQ